MAQPLDQITNQTVVGGHGMVATQNILKGTVILEENPLVVIDTILRGYCGHRGRLQPTSTPVKVRVRHVV
jgi:hypothetical protein